MPAKKKTVADRIRHLHPCDEALEWAAGYMSPLAAWKACERGDWMLWCLRRLAGTDESRIKPVVLAACACARLALPHVRAGEGRPLRTIETAERWARGEEGVTIEDVRAARVAAAAAAADAAAAAADAAYAADAAADDAAAADAAYAAAAAADDDAYAAYAAAAAAADDAADAAYAARKKTLKRCADLVRQRFPKPPLSWLKE